MAEPTDLASLLALAESVAVEAGALVLDGLTKARVLVGTKSTLTDMVTEVDRAAEALIVARLLEARPDDGILGEEGTVFDGSTGVRWVIDPIDGTTNYLYGFPAFCVSIAAEVEGERSVAAVVDPLRGEVFTASRGNGARLNGAEIRCRPLADLSTALVGTGFAYAAERRAWQAQFVAHLLPRVRDIRRAGSAALDLCWVAAGRLDATCERGLRPWDLAAGTLVVEEAGGRIMLDDADWQLVCSSAPGIADALFSLVAESEAAAGPRPSS